MVKTNLVTTTLFCILGLCLTACAREPNYRGVPSATWQHLTAEQKQLIVDRSFQDEMA